MHGCPQIFTQEGKTFRGEGRGLEQIFCHKKHRKETILGRMWVLVGLDRTFSSSADSQTCIFYIENCNKIIVDKLET